MAEVIAIDGLSRFVRNLRKFDRELPKAVRLAGNEAAQIVVDEAKPRVPLGPGKGGHARSSVKAQSTQSAARVAGGGKRFPYYPWLDFGGRVGRNNSVRRPFLKEGRYLWAAFAEKRPEVDRALSDALIAIGRRADVRVTDR